MRGAVWIAGGVAALLLLAELLALPVAARVLSSTLAGCLPHEHLAVQQVGRPVVPWLLLGRARDIELQATGVQLGDLRIAEAQLSLEQAVLPWAIGSPDPGDLRVDLLLTERDLDRAIRGAGPFGVPLTVELEPGVATVGARDLPLSVRLGIEAVDGRLQVRPVAGDGGWWDQLGLGAYLDPPPDIEVRAAAIEPGQLTGTLQLATLPAIGGGGGCDEPLGSS